MPTVTPAQFLTEQPDEVACNCGTLVLTPFPSIARRHGILCATCADENNSKVLKEAQTRCQIIDASGWEKICPVEFQNTEAHKLPSPTKLQKVMEWKYGAKGLMLHGVTGQGKSRCLYALLKREFKSGRTIRVLTHDAGYRYAERFNDSPAEVLKWIEDKTHVDILALDDIFKVKLTESFEQALFTIISQRTERGKPVLLTCQDNGATLTARMSADRGAALVRRFREYCQAIGFLT